MKHIETAIAFAVSALFATQASACDAWNLGRKFRMDVSDATVITGYLKQSGDELTGRAEEYWRWPSEKPDRTGQIEQGRIRSASEGAVGKRDTKATYVRFRIYWDYPRAHSADKGGSGSIPLLPGGGASQPYSAYEGTIGTDGEVSGVEFLPSPAMHLWSLLGPAKCVVARASDGTAQGNPPVPVTGATTNTLELEKR